MFMMPIKTISLFSNKKLGLNKNSSNVKLHCAFGSSPRRFVDNQLRRSDGSVKELNFSRLTYKRSHLTYLEVVILKKNRCCWNVSNACVTTV